MSQFRRIGTVMLLVLLAAIVAGCGSHDAVQTPAGMKVGPPLTQAQVQAIQQKRAIR